MGGYAPTVTGFRFEAGWYKTFLARAERTGEDPPATFYVSLTGAGHNSY
jgi:hypothetical protein